MTELIIGCSMIVVALVYVSIELLRGQTVYTVQWDSKRKDKRAPLLHRMFLATKIIVFQGRVI